MGQRPDGLSFGIDRHAESSSPALSPSLPDTADRGFNTCPCAVRRSGISRSRGAGYGLAASAASPALNTVLQSRRNSSPLRRQRKLRQWRLPSCVSLTVTA